MSREDLSEALACASWLILHQGRQIVEVDLIWCFVVQCRVRSSLILQRNVFASSLLAPLTQSEACRYTRDMLSCLKVSVKSGPPHTDPTRVPLGMQEFHCSARLEYQGYTTQDAQKGRSARPQRAKRRGGTNRASCGPFSYAIDLGERKSPASTSDLRESLRYVEPLSDARTPLAELFQHPAW